MFVSLRGVVMYVVERLRISCLVLELTVGRRNDRSSIQCFFQSLQIMNLCICNLVHLTDEIVARFCLCAQIKVVLISLKNNPDVDDRFHSMIFCRPLT